MKISTAFSSIVFCIALFLLSSAARAAESNEFFAMNTIAHGRPAEVVPLLKELGYAGLGGAVGDGEMATALKAAGLRYYNGYLTLTFTAETPVLDDTLRQQIEAMKGHNASLWLSVVRVRKNDQAFANSSTDADDTVVAKLREIVAYAEPRGVTIALYPHAATWLEKVEDATRIANKIDSPAVGVTFNLCHWLKVEGSERDPLPVLKAALPRLMFVTINGADSGDTRAMGWWRLIQPLGQGSYDVAALMRGIRASGYRGPVGFQGFGIRAAPREVLQQSMAAWKGF